ncbi:hypothetical protein PBY51_007007 [Eleginops maclovinus]|uniref:Uncharacterized protein n=1 Tax=Eleginops maclovinus TaxID=56733 RepID=A0AAN8AAU0_ELEMC|nr:hypothetical protein PBY51_007007 [Eleginops maclovinus]
MSRLQTLKVLLTPACEQTHLADFTLTVPPPLYLSERGVFYSRRSLIWFIPLHKEFLGIAHQQKTLNQEQGNDHSRRVWRNIMGAVRAGGPKSWR